MDCPDDPHDLDGALERAEHELTREELDRAVHHAEGVAEKAAGKELFRWILWLAVGASLVAGVVHEPRYLLVGFLLMVLSAIPYIAAGVSTARREKEREDLTDAIHEHERRARGEPPPAVGGRPGTA